MTTWLLNSLLAGVLAAAFALYLSAELAELFGRIAEGLR